MKVKDISEVNVEVKLRETFTVTTIMTEKKNVENQAVSVSNRYYGLSLTLEIVFQNDCDVSASLITQWWSMTLPRYWRKILVIDGGS